MAAARPGPHNRKGLSLLPHTRRGARPGCCLPAGRVCLPSLVPAFGGLLLGALKVLTLTGCPALPLSALPPLPSCRRLLSWALSPVPPHVLLWGVAGAGVRPPLVWPPAYATAVTTVLTVPSGPSGGPLGSSDTRQLRSFSTS